MNEERTRICFIGFPDQNIRLLQRIAKKIDRSIIFIDSDEESFESLKQSEFLFSSLVLYSLLEGLDEIIATLESYQYFLSCQIVILQNSTLQTYLEELKRNTNVTLHSVPLSLAQWIVFFELL